jgi:hypothetical protein
MDETITEYKAVNIEDLKHFHKDFYGVTNVMVPLL